MGLLSEVFGHIGSGPANAIATAATKLQQQAGKLGASAGRQIGGAVSQSMHKSSGSSSTDAKLLAKELAVQKASYMSVLTHALERAHDKGIFNLDMELNELMPKLNALRSGKADLKKIAEIIAKDPSHDKDLDEMLRKLGVSAKEGVQKIKGSG